MKTCSRLASSFGWILLIVLGELFFFRDLFTPGAMLGDGGDARLYQLILEHWLHVFQGREPWDTLSEFYPFSGTLGYTDTFLGQAILYVPLRLLNFDMFSAYKITMVVWHAVGCLALFIFLGCFLKLERKAAFLGASAFFWANGFALILSYSRMQIMALSLLPVFLVLAAWAVQEHRVLLRIALGIASVLVLALTAYSGWYVFYFAVLFVVVWLVCLAISVYFENNVDFRKIGRFFGAHIAEALVYVAVFCLALWPLLSLYWPVAQRCGMREWEIVNLGLPQLSDVINMGAGNFTLGWFFRLNDFSMWRVKLENEVCQGYSLVFWALVIYLAWCYLRRRSAFAFPTTDQSEFGTFRHLVIRSLGVATVFSFVLIISFGSCSLWWFFWKCMPGASSLRFMGRWWLFLLLPFSILVAYLINYHKFKRVWHVPLITFTLWLSNIYGAPLTHWNAIEQVSFLAEMPQPPSQAKVIAVYSSDNQKTKKRAWDFQLDAWLIADHFGLQTVNGYSGQFTPNFELLWDSSESSSFVGNLAKYKALNGIADTVYLYDEASATWRPDTNL